MKELELMAKTMDLAMSRIFDRNIDNSLGDAHRHRKEMALDNIKSVQQDIIDAVLGDFSREQVVEIVKVEMRLLMDAVSTYL